MPQFNGQNKKRIDPRYFLDEVTPIKEFATLAPHLPRPGFGRRAWRKAKSLARSMDSTAAMRTIRTMCPKIDMGADLSPDDKTNIVASFIKASQFNPRGYGKGGHYDKCRTAIGLPGGAVEVPADSRERDSRIVRYTIDE